MSQLDREHAAFHIRSLQAVTLVRWCSLLIIGIFFLVKYTFQLEFGMLPELQTSLFLLVIFINVVWTIILRQLSPDRLTQNVRRLAFMQLMTDELLVTFIIASTDTLPHAMLFQLFYCLTILGGTLFFADEELILLTTLSLVLYAGTAIFQFYEILPSTWLATTGWSHTQLIIHLLLVGIQTFLFAVMAMLVRRTIRDREDHIQTEKMNLYSVLRALEDGIIILDPEYRVILINPPARDVLQLSQDMTGFIFTNKVVADELQPIADVLLTQLPTKQLRQSFVIPGTEIPRFISIDSIPIYDPDGSIRQWAHVLHDDTRQHELDQIKSDFISIAAHQLRTPLAGLKWFFHMMLDGDAGSVSEEQKAFLRQAHQRTDDMINIVNDLLDISEIEEGKSNYKFEPTALDQVLIDLMKRSELTAQYYHIAIDYQPPQSRLPLLQLDASKIAMALQNILDNAIKYSQAHSQVTIAVEEDGSYCVVKITDHGIGIPPSEQPYIFSKFFRGTNAQGYVTTGSGLGLYIVKNIIDKHDGKIWFVSVEGKGTTFYIALPIPVSTNQTLNQDFLKHL